jgi:ribosomal protein S27AE
MKRVLFYKSIRNERLRSEGFLPFEAQALSRNKIGSKLMKNLRRERITDWAEYWETAKNPSYTGWTRKILKMYDDNIENNKPYWKTKRGKRNPFARLREIEDEKKKADYTKQHKSKKIKVTTQTFKAAAKKTKQRYARTKGDLTSMQHPVCPQCGKFMYKTKGKFICKHCGFSVKMERGIYETSSLSGVKGKGKHQGREIRRSKPSKA